MKQCPKCSFANAERYPACVMCNTAIYDVESTVPEPGDSDYAQWALNQKRNRALDRQERSASVLYALSITGSALYPGLVFDPWVLFVYFLGALAVGAGVRRQWGGPFVASLVQGGFSLAALMVFGPVQPLAFYMLVAHASLAVVFCHWIQSIRDMGL